MAIENHGKPPCSSPIGWYGSGDFLLLSTDEFPTSKLPTNHCFLQNGLVSLQYYCCRVPKGGVFKGGGNWGILRIPTGRLGNLRED